MTGRRSRWSRPKKASTIPGVMNQKESVFQSNVGKYAVAKGALHYHTHNSERSEGGFPDSVIVGNYIMFRELKSDSDSATVSKKQREWIEKLESVGADVGVWWPIDWASGKAQAEIDACVRKRKPDGSIILPDLTWLARHELDGNAGASAFFEALRSDLIANARGKDDK